MDLDMEIGPDANREYKDSVFTLLFGTKEAALEAGNYVLGTKYGPDTELIFTTLKNTFNKGRFNDLSFVLDRRLIVLIEHQSTVNENMPLRMLIYVGEILDVYTKTLDLYKEKMIKIPKPVFFVFNTGEGMKEDRRELRLSDMFIDDGDGVGGSSNLELVVTVLNISDGFSSELMERFPIVMGYGMLVHKIQENRKTMSLYDAIKKAVFDCIDQNILKTFLESQKKEIVGMLHQEWKLSEAVVVAKEEGKEEALLKVAKNLREMGMGVDEVAKATGLTVDDVLRL
jgi:hypothetical protein